jgi:hypothetical protein
MVAALLVLALSGAFSQVGVLGQLFVGPSLPGAATAGGQPGSGVGPRGTAAAALPVIPAVPISASASVSSPRRAVVRHAPAGRPVLTASRGTGVAGGAIGTTGGTVVTVGTGGSGGGTAGGSGGSGGGPPAGSSPGSGSTSPQPAPPPQPKPKPTPVDTAVTVVTSVTQQVPAPVGPAVTQTVQAAGSVVDSLIPQTGQP